jgi:hypothetical protein
MAETKATTPAAYIADLPADRRATIAAVRDLVLRNLPDGYVESLNWGMLSYEIPLERYPDTYNGQPLGYAGIASRKNYITLYLMGVYAVPGLLGKLEKAFRAAGKKWDMGKSCLHFRTMEDLEVDALAEVIAAVSVDRYIELFEASRRRTGSAKKSGAKKKIGAPKKSGAKKKVGAPKKKGNTKRSSKSSGTRSSSN